MSLLIQSSLSILVCCFLFAGCQKESRSTTPHSNSTKNDELAGAASNVRVTEDFEWTTIKVSRSKNAVFSIAAQAQIKVNGKSMGALANGQSKEFRIPPQQGISEFVITYHTLDGNTSQDGTTQFFSAKPGARIEVDIDLGAWDGEWVRRFSIIEEGSW